MKNEKLLNNLRIMVGSIEPIWNNWQDWIVGSMCSGGSLFNETQKLMDLKRDWMDNSAMERRVAS